MFNKRLFFKTQSMCHRDVPLQHQNASMIARIRTRNRPTITTMRYTVWLSEFDTDKTYTVSHIYSSQIHLAVHSPSQGAHSASSTANRSHQIQSQTTHRRSLTLTPVQQARYLPYMRSQPSAPVCVVRYGMLGVGVCGNANRIAARVADCWPLHRYEMSQ